MPPVMPLPAPSRSLMAQAAPFGPASSSRRQRTAPLAPLLPFPASARVQIPLKCRPSARHHTRWAAPPPRTKWRSAERACCLHHYLLSSHCVHCWRRTATPPTSLACTLLTSRRSSAGRCHRGRAGPLHLGHLQPHPRQDRPGRHRRHRLRLLPPLRPRHRAHAQPGPAPLPLQPLLEPPLPLRHGGGGQPGAAGNRAWQETPDTRRSGGQQGGLSSTVRRARKDRPAGGLLMEPAHPPLARRRAWCFTAG
jgi:hypothetical protein